MIGLAVGDLHLMGRTPVSRTDDFPTTQHKKVNDILSISSVNKVDYIFQAGDFFDSCKPSFSLIRKYMYLLKRLDTPWYAVLGQHDLYMWNLGSVGSTAMGVVEAGGVVKLITRQHLFEDFELYGCSWGQEVPKPDMTDKFKILVIHKNIFEAPLFNGHDIIKPKSFIQNNPGFDFIICGDCHFPFECTYDGTTIVNTGIICRKSIIERDINPSVIKFDTSTGKYEWIKLEVDNDVFSNKVEVTDEIFLNKDLEYLRTIVSTNGEKISFESSVLKALELEEDNEVKELASKILSEIKGNGKSKRL